MRKSAKADLDCGLLFGAKKLSTSPFLTGGAGSPISPFYDAINDEDRFISAPPPYPPGHGEGSHLIVVVPLDQAPRRSFLIFPAVFQVHSFCRIADKD